MTLQGVVLTEVAAQCMEPAQCVGGDGGVILCVFMVVLFYVVFGRIESVNNFYFVSCRLVCNNLDNLCFFLILWTWLWHQWVQCRVIKLRWRPNFG